MAFVPPVIDVWIGWFSGTKTYCCDVRTTVFGPTNERKVWFSLREYVFTLKHSLPPLPWCLLYLILSGRRVGDFQVSSGVIEGMYVVERDGQ
jgi:hypothetical protein